MSAEIEQCQTRVVVDTRGPGLVDITRHVRDWLESEGGRDGLLTLFIRHTSASLVIQENADPDVLRDLKDFFQDVAPRTRAYRHDAEGPDDMPAHIRAALTQTSLSIPVTDGRMELGTWQGIYVFEHRDHPHKREVACHFLGTRA
ncbi:MAG: secondary thiamine-phosphate synthase enzyme YjbQ [Pseudomonadota bacterium]